MGYRCFDVTLDEKIAHIVLSRPEKRNSMIPEFWDELPEIVRDIEARGASWELLVNEITITPEAVADALRDAGFWTAKDIEARPRKAQAVLCKLLGYSVVSLARAARQMKGVNDAR